MNQAEVREALNGGSQRLVLLLKDGEIVSCSSPRSQVDGDQVVVFVGGQRRAVDLDVIESVGRQIINRRALAAA